jgi:hypothetical protein
MNLYHKDIRLPPHFRGLPAATVQVKWTRHAEDARSNDRYGYIPKHERLNLREAETIEVGIEDGRLVHLLLRMPYDGKRDILFALRPVAGKPWVIKTVWLNRTNDRHKTLNKSRYMK